MKNSNQDKIDRYLKNQFSLEEKQAFEKELSANDNLAKDLLAQREAIAIVEDLGDHRVKTNIRNAVEKAEQKVRSKKVGRRNILLLLLALLALSFSLFYFLQKEEKEEEPIKSNILYAANYQVPDLTFGDRGEEEILTAASIAYAKKEYSKALQLFTKVATEKEDAKLALAKAICHIELQEYDSARKKLSNFLDDPLYGAHCRWYYALLLLKKGDPAARSQFEILARSPDGFQQNAAQDILEKIKK